MILVETDDLVLILTFYPTVVLIIWVSKTLDLS